MKMSDWEKFTSLGGKRKELIVAIHGYSSAGNRLASVREVIRTAWPDADIFAPELPFARHKLCRRPADDFVAELIENIQQIVDARKRVGGEYASITLVGHSFGAVLARKIVVLAFGEQRNDAGECPAPFGDVFAKFREEPRDWAPLIKRVILLAGMNRGWSVSSTLDWWTSVQWSLFQFIGENLPGNAPTIFAIRRGAPFLIQTRLQWLALMDPKYGPRPEIVTVQLLGTVDDSVSPSDNVDYSVDLFGEGGQSYFYLEVEESGHANVIEMSANGPPSESEFARKKRREKFLIALDAGTEALKAECIAREDMADILPPESDPEVTDVVFVVHGIRDKGYWTQKVARTIKRLSTKTFEKKRKFASWTSSYGYFAMLPFVFPSVRQRKVEWLMDQYAEARARYPNADFHYVGHSNGTYLAAQALQDYPAVRFKRIVFAGSVVRTDYRWSSVTEKTKSNTGASPRVEQVLNYVATADWVVALFPKGLQPWRWFNLGSAGHDGFDEATEDGPVYQVEYIIGDHGAGHQESNWEDIARFIVLGAIPRFRELESDSDQRHSDENPDDHPPFSRSPSGFIHWIGKHSHRILAISATAIIGFGALLFISEAAWSAFGFFVFLLFIYLTVTRF
jgi:pimeloyl-ACP methyl ester carboxylesterase